MIRYMLVLAVLFTACKKEAAEPEGLRNGDIIFQTSESDQSKAIELATHSKYTHCGIILKHDNEDYVVEAVQPVTTTPLADWIAGGKDGHYVVKRLKDPKILTDKAIEDMRTQGRDMIGKDYDLYFEWNNDRIYCSELVWKLYNHATGLKLGKLQKLKDFDLTSPVVKEKLKERFGNTIPMEEMVIAPDAIFESQLLEKVVEK